MTALLEARGLAIRYPSPRGEVRAAEEVDLEVGRSYDEIEKTVIVPLDPGASGEKVGELLDTLGSLAALGVEVAHGSVPDVSGLRRLEILGEQVVPAIASL